MRDALVPSHLIAQSGQASGNGIGGTNTSVPAGKMVIRGFMLAYTGIGDHHLSRMSILPNNNGALRVNWHDKNADDGMTQRVRWSVLR